MGDHMGKIQKSTTLASPGDVSVNQRQASDLGATDRPSPIGRNTPIPTGLRELPRGTKPPLVAADKAAAGYQRPRPTMQSHNLLDSIAKADAAKAAAKAAIAAEAAADNKRNSPPVLPQGQNLINRVNRISLRMQSHNLLDSTAKADAAKAAAKAAIVAEAAAGNEAIR